MWSALSLYKQCPHLLGVIPHLFCFKTCKQAALCFTRNISLDLSTSVHFTIRSSATLGFPRADSIADQAWKRGGWLLVAGSLLPFLNQALAPLMLPCDCSKRAISMSNGPSLTHHKWLLTLYNREQNVNKSYSPSISHNTMDYWWHRQSRKLKQNWWLVDMGYLEP